LATKSPPAEALTQGLKCKTNTLPILMHKMHIDYLNLFSDVQFEKDENLAGSEY
jgi:hypothetical protein